MTKLRTDKKAHAFRGVAALITAAFLVLFFIGCNHAAGGKKSVLPVQKHTVAFSVEGANGTLKATVDGGTETATSPITIEKGKTITFTATPDAGYRVKSWTLNEVAVNGTNKSYSLKIEKEVTVKVRFEKLPPELFMVTFSVEGANGTLKAKADGIAETNTSPISVEKGKTVTFTAKASDGYRIKAWTLDGNAVNGTNNSYTLTVTKAAEVKVQFSSIIDGVWKVVSEKKAGTSGTTTYPMQAPNGAEMQPYSCFWEGKLYMAAKLSKSPDPSDDGLYKTGEPVSFTFDGTKIFTDGNEYASVSLSGNTMTFTSTNASIANIVFEKTDSPTVKEMQEAGLPPAKHTVKFSVDGGNGTIKAEVDGAEIHSNSSIEQDKLVTFTATPVTGYAVDNWTVTGGSFETGSGTVYNNTAKLTVTADTEVKVSFIQGTVYTVEGIRFMMKDIAAVTNGTVGHSGEPTNQPHQVNIPAYRIGETEVTQELWQAVMGDNPSSFKDSPKKPVENINWYECIAFCNELTKKVNGGSEAECVYRALGNIYDKESAKAEVVPEVREDKKGFRLPKDVEWEWAAKGGTEDKWAGTNDESKLVEYAWYRANSEWKTHEVKTKKPNGYGLYDMSGNVFEFCWEEYSPSSKSRLVHGGNWDSRAAAFITRSHREYLEAKNRGTERGLRVVCGQ